MFVPPFSGLNLFMYSFLVGGHEVVMLAEPGHEMITTWHRIKTEQSD